MLQCNRMRPARKSEPGIFSNKKEFTMQLFRTELSIPQTLHFADRPRSYRAALRYGHARLLQGARSAAIHPSAPACVIVELPRVQAVVDAIIYSRAA